MVQITRIKLKAVYQLTEMEICTKTRKKELNLFISLNRTRVAWMCTIYLYIIYIYYFLSVNICMWATPPAHTWQNGVIPDEYLHHARIASTGKPSHPIKSGSYPKSTVHCHLVVTHYTCWLLLHSFEATELKYNTSKHERCPSVGSTQPGASLLAFGFC